MSKASPMAVFRHRDFTILWFGSALGVFGGQFTTVATAWQIYELTSSALQLGLLGLARGLSVALQLLGPPTVPEAGRRAPSLESLGEGVHFVWTHRVLLCMMALDFGQNFFSNPRALLPIYARDILSVGPEGLGMLYAA